MAQKASVAQKAPSAQKASAVQKTPAALEQRNAMIDIDINKKAKFEKDGMIKSGRVRVRDQKKRLSTLKKKVLLERLKNWRAYESTKLASSDGAPRGKRPVLCLFNYIVPDEDTDILEDDEEFEETKSALLELASTVGSVSSVHIPRKLSNKSSESVESSAFFNDEDHIGKVFVTFNESNDAETAQAVFDGMVVGGNRVTAILINIEESLNCSIPGNSILNPINHIHYCNAKNDSDVQMRTVCIYNYVHDCNLEDEDEYEEILSNLEDMANQVGPGATITMQIKNNDGKVNVLFKSVDEAKTACRKWNGMVIGGDELDVRLGIENGTLSSTEIGGKMHSLNNENIFQKKKVCINNFVDEDQLEDEDEFREIQSNLQNMADQFGRGAKVVIPRKNADGFVGKAYVEFLSVDEAKSAFLKWNGLTLGGDKLDVRLEDECIASCTEIMKENAHVKNIGTIQKNVVCINNFVEEDELKDKDEYEEILSNLQDMADQIGPAQVMIPQKNTDGIVGKAYVEFESVGEAKAACLKWDRLVIGGNELVVYLDDKIAGCSRVNLQEETNIYRSSVLLIKNVMREEDFDDDECLEETMQDLRSMIEDFGVEIDCIAVLNKEEKENSIVEVKLAVEERKILDLVKNLDGKLVAGENIEVECQVSPAENMQFEKPSLEKEKKNRYISQNNPEPINQPMYSVNGKKIPDRFAICKRVPKIPNSAPARNYALKFEDTVTPKSLVIEMLGELMRLQARSKNDVNARSRRRLVMGLREVARGIRSHKIKMVIMACNLDEYGAIDCKLQEIINLAEENDAPIIFELTKRAIGKALGKSIKIGVVGIQNADGAHPQFKKLVKLVSTSVRSPPDYNANR
uniref:RRM domain-containing protein n=1 Tax=Corethron hystrix TaxID=216773 RepID=A0A7S1B9S1_9STRA